MNEIDLVKIQAREIFYLRDLVNKQNALIEDFLKSEAALISDLQEMTYRVTESEGGEA